MKLSRRTVLRGAGVTLALPWLESLGSRGAKASGATPPKRLLVVFFPNGSAEWWRPVQVGVGDAWQLSPILQPFAPLKAQMSVLSNVENHSPVQESPEINPSDGRDAGMFLTGTDASALTTKLQRIANGVSMDQLIAQGMGAGGGIESLVVGLSTYFAYCDGRDCRYSRNISWSTQTDVAPRLVDPQAVWDLLFKSSAPQQGRSPRLDKSVLDAVSASTQAVRKSLGQADQRRLDAYLGSIRDVELRLQAMPSCVIPARPAVAVPSDGLPTNSATYNRGEHAALMNDLIALAFQCGLTRVTSYMLDDERSEFVYSHVKKRTFSATGSVEAIGGETCGNFNGSTHAGAQGDEFASINRWFSQVTSELCQKLAAMPEGEGTVLDNTVVLYASCMHGSDDQADDLPVALLGGKGVLKQDQHFAFPISPDDCALRDIHFTLMNQYFGLGVSSFGESVRTTQNRTVSEILV